MALTQYFYQTPSAYQVFGCDPNPACAARRWAVEVQPLRGNKLCHAQVRDLLRLPRGLLLIQLLLQAADLVAERFEHFGLSLFLVLPVETFFL